MASSEIPFQGHINLLLNEVRNFRVQSLASDPTGTEARLYYNTSTKTLRWHNGTAWKPLLFDTYELAGAGLTNSDVDTLAVVYGPTDTGNAFGQTRVDGTANSASRSDHRHALPVHDAEAHSTLKISDLAAPATSVAWNNNRITGLADGTGPADAVTKQQLDAVAVGLDVKPSVTVATIGPLTPTYVATGGVSTRGQMTGTTNSVDGVTLTVGTRVLVKDQTAGDQNGIYSVTTVGTGVNGVWDRATDFDSDGEVSPGAFTFVEKGTANADSGWVLTTDGTVTVGGVSGTILTFIQFSGAGQITAGAGMSKTGNTLNIGAGTGILANADDIAVDTAVIPRKYSTDVGDGILTDYVITHNLGTRDVRVTLRNSISPYEEFLVPNEATSTTTVTLKFAVAPTLNQFRVAVTG